MSHVATRRAAAALALRLALSLAACQDATGPRVPEATFTGRWADSAWAGSAAALLVPGGAAGDTLYIGGSLPVGGLYPLQSLRIRVAPFRGAGEYALAGADVTMEDIVGGDAVSSSYVGARPLAGTLVVDEYAPAGAAPGAVRGGVRFQAVHAYGQRPWGTSSAFEDGRFRADVRVFTPPR